jgi:hypothetical protein
MLAAGAERQLKITTAAHDLIELIHGKVDTAVDICALCCAARIWNSSAGTWIGSALLSTIVCQ